MRFNVYLPTLFVVIFCFTFPFEIGIIITSILCYVFIKRAKYERQSNGIVERENFQNPVEFFQKTIDKRKTVWYSIYRGYVGRLPVFLSLTCITRIIQVKRRNAEWNLRVTKRLHRKSLRI